MTTKTNLPAALAGAAVPTDQAAVADHFINEGSRLSSGGKQFLKYSKGDWTIGRDNESFPDNGFEFVPNMMAIQHGFQCWKGGMPVDEMMVSFFKPLPDKTGLADHSPYPNPQQDGWSETVKLPLIILPRMGVKVSIEAEFSSSSSGGKNAMGSLNKEYGAYLKTGQYGGQLPIVRAGSSHYKHTTYGKVYTPTLNIVGWVHQDDLHVILSGGPAPARKGVQAVIAPSTTAPAPRTSVLGGEVLPAPAEEVQAEVVDATVVQGAAAPAEDDLTL